MENDEKKEEPKPTFRSESSDALQRLFVDEFETPHGDSLREFVENLPDVPEDPLSDEAADAILKAAEGNFQQKGKPMIKRDPVMEEKTRKFILSFSKKVPASVVCDEGEKAGYHFKPPRVYVVRARERARKEREAYKARKAKLKAPVPKAPQKEPNLPVVKEESAPVAEHEPSKTRFSAKDRLIAAAMQLSLERAIAILEAIKNA